jgi:single-stranded-DNA-specific exonuclease
VRWQSNPIDLEATATLARGLNIPGASLIAQLLVARGITDPEAAERFLHPSLDHLHSPYLMLGMQTAVDRIAAAIANKEDILVYGDYDVDGTTAIVILKTAIELCGGTVDFHVPHRIREGYGMRDEVIERAAAAGVRLIISVDTGIRAFEAAETAHRLSVDLIVTDHHLPGPEGVPRAQAVLNPNQAGCGYPCKDVCGAGVAFKVAQALLEKEGRARLLPSFLKVVALATIADSVPLRDENRVFARLGLDGLRLPVNLGLKALFQVAQLDGSRPVTATDIAFRVAPRINAAGRMDVARDVIDLFTVKDAARAREIATRLDQLNAERQNEERRILDEIFKRFEENPALAEPYCLVIDGEGWHRGVIGITATRVVERYHRPTLVVACENGEAHGSGRSIPAFHLLEAMESCAELFTRFGGHAHACGFALPVVRLPELRERLDTFARGRLTPSDLEPVLEVDGELPIEQITPEFFATLQQLEPFGVENPEPVFSARAVRLAAPPRFIKDKHVRMRFGAGRKNGEEARSSSGNGGWRNAVVYDAMGWRLGDSARQAGLIVGDSLDIAFTLDQNHHPEFGGMEFSLLDFRKV